MTTSPRSLLRHLMLAIAALLATSAGQAGDAARGKRPPPPAVYLEECASCHAAFLPRMLPAASWQRLLQGLPEHFGTDASLDAALTREIGSWLLANAGDAKRFPSAPEQDRITRARWFTRQHDEIPEKSWQRPAIRQPSNCTACHRSADQGVFNEHDVRIPK